MSDSNYPIDFIITWVDGSDPAWQAEKAKYQGKTGDARANRYREWDTLKYWFRGVEKFAPWVNNVFFVTWGHLPVWLNTTHPKLRIINHRDYIPEDYLPTFSSRPIDMNFHRIEELSEHFVYFNDDMFLIRSVERSDFFIDGLPCDSAIQDVIAPKGRGTNGESLIGDTQYTAIFYDTAVINRNFDKRVVLKENHKKWFSLKYKRNVIKNYLLNEWNYFTGFKMIHMPYSYLKKTYREVWEKEPTVLSQACKNKFRTINDVNHFVFSYWQLAKGTFMPRGLNEGSLMSLANDDAKNQRIYSTIRNQSKKFICVNDTFTGDNYEEVKRNLIYSFDTILSEKSSYEV